MGYNLGNIMTSNANYYDYTSILLDKNSSSTIMVANGPPCKEENILSCRDPFKPINPSKKYLEEGYPNINSMVPPKGPKINGSSFRQGSMVSPKRFEGLNGKTMYWCLLCILGNVMLSTCQY